jgi:hypothetical protein
MASAVIGAEQIALNCDLRSRASARTVSSNRGCAGSFRYVLHLERPVCFEKRGFRPALFVVPVQKAVATWLDLLCRHRINEVRVWVGDKSSTR